MTNTDTLIEALVKIADDAHGPSAAESVGNLYDIAVGDATVNDFSDQHMDLLQAMENKITELTDVEWGSDAMIGTLDELLDAMGEPDNDYFND